MLGNVFENSIREKLYNYDYPYRDDSWNQFKNQLPGSNNLLSFVKPVLYVVVPVILLGLVAFYYSYKNTDSKINRKLIKNTVHINLNIVNKRKIIAENKIDQYIIISDNKTNIVVNPANQLEEDSLSNIANKSENKEPDTIVASSQIDQAQCYNLSAHITDYCALKVCFDFKFKGTVQAVNWEFGDGKKSDLKKPCHKYSKAGTYKIGLQVRFSDNTISKLSGVVNIPDLPIANFTMTNNENTYKFVSSANNASSLIWDFNIPGLSTTIDNPVVTFDNPGKYYVSLIVFNDYGCYDTLIKEIQIPEKSTFFMPTGFSPNGDGICDLAGPEGIGLNTGNFEFTVYNGYGELIFKTHDVNEKWNGKIMNSGEYCNPGFYIWNILIEKSNKKTIKRKGIIRLLK